MAKAVGSTSGSLIRAEDDPAEVCRAEDHPASWYEKHRSARRREAVDSAGLETRGPNALPPLFSAFALSSSRKVSRPFPLHGVPNRAYSVVWLFPPEKYTRDRPRGGEQRVPIRGKPAPLASLQGFPTPRRFLCVGERSMPVRKVHAP